MISLVAVGLQRSFLDSPVDLYICKIHDSSKIISYEPFEIVLPRMVKYVKRGNSPDRSNEIDTNDEYKNILPCEKTKLNKELKKIIDEKKWLKIAYILFQKKSNNILTLHCREFVERFFGDENCQKMKEKMSILKIGWEEWRSKDEGFEPDYNFRYRGRVLQICVNRIIGKYIDDSCLELIDKQERILSSMQDVDHVCYKFIKFCENNVGRKRR